MSTTVRSSCPVCGKESWAKVACQDCRRAAWSKCETCGESTGKPDARYCSRACISKWYTCEHCGEAFSRRASGSDALRYCGRACSMQARAAEPKVRAVCRCGAAREVGRKLCSACIQVQDAELLQRALRVEQRREQRIAKANRPKPEWHCSACGSAEMADPRSPFCAPCRRVVKRSRKRHHSRARHFGVAYEPVNAVAVFHRDNWTCHLCGDAIAPDAKWPDRMCASLDHVVPMSKGGPHTYENVSAAHWLCNTYKSDDETLHFRVA